ncbi:hypothetical protein [Anaerorhabdus sp.]|jgi:foldase protein PrsA|uniref:hypothetical protein n=1 Tax=Anaerorhabdus sp. TaxID=1872524 RepID=UPI002FC7CBC1
MKKILLSLCALLLLAGCSDAYGKLTDGNTELFTIGETSITKDDLFQTMKSQASGYAALSEATRVILENEVPVTDELKASADASLQTYKTTFGEGFTTAIQSYGFKDEEDFYNNSLLVNAQLVELTKKYVTDNFDALVTKYDPKEVIVLTFATEEDAKAAKTDLENGTDALTVGSNYNSTSAGAERIVTTETDLDTNVKSFIQNATEPTISDVIIGAEAETFSIVQVTEADANNIKDEITTVLANLDTMASESDVYYFKKYGFKIYDKDLHDNIEVNYPDYLF